jgi:hypothetical protein
MATSGNTRSARLSIRCAHAWLAIAALFAVLVARNLPFHFPTGDDPHSGVHALSSHDQRPRFSCDGLKCSIPAARFAPLPPSSEAAHVAPTPELLSTLQTKGFHYNRPPPAV